MNFERHPAPYDHFNQSPSLARRVNAKKEKEDKEKSLLVLKTVLITLGSVAVAGFLAFLVLRNFQGSSEGPSSTTNDLHLEPLNSLSSNQEGTLPLDPQISIPSSSSDTSTLNSYGPPYPTGHNLMLFTSSQAIFAINPADYELITDRLIDLESNSSNSFYLSNDKMRIYFADARNIKSFNFNGRLFNNVNFANWDYTTFMLLKSAGNNAIYRTEGFSRYAAFLHYSFDESRTVYSYSHTCPDGNAPSLLEQTNDGSKFIYSCYPSGEVLIKELNNSNEGHQRLFTLRDFHNAILCPDDVTLIMYGYGINHWVIKNLSSPNLESPPKIIRFNVDITRFGFRNFAFSNDGRSLYAIREIEISRNTYQYRLYTIDMQSFLGNDYSNAASPYNLGEGREITIT